MPGNKTSIILKVAHLRVLTTKIAPNHPGNSTLLTDIKATYKWLNENSEQAREYLIPLATEELFLNVDDPYEERWGNQWVAAQNLVLDFDYDFQDIKRVRQFLKEYSNLLRASGCSQLNLTSKLQTAAAGAVATVARRSRLSEMSRVFDEMRKRGELTDMALIPTWDLPTEFFHSWEEGGRIVREGIDLDPERESEDGPTVEKSLTEQDVIDLDIHPDHIAHHVILAAALPYFRDRAKGWSRSIHGRLDLIGFVGTPFGAKAVLGKDMY